MACLSKITGDLYKEEVEYFESIVKSINEPFMIISKDYKILMANMFAKNIFAIDLEDGTSGIEGSQILMEKFGINCNDKNDSINIVMNTGFPIKIERDLNDLFGKYIEINILPLKGKKETVSAVLAMFYDITNYKKNEKRLERNFQIFNATVESTAEGIIVFDNQGNILSANKSFSEIFEIKTNFRGFENKKQVFIFIEQYLNNFITFYKTLQMVEEDNTSEYFELICMKDMRVVEFCSRPVIFENETIGRMWSFHDITTQKTIEKKLEQMAHYDSLTELPNRMLFFDRLGQILGNAKRYGFKFALLFIDLDRFKLINDSLGHSSGDIMLKEVAERLKSCLREADTVARMGGDEFTVILSKIASKDDAAYVAEKIIKSLEKPFILGGQECSIGASIGISVFPEDGATMEILMRNSDMAMYSAKEHGKNIYRFYVPIMDNSTFNKLQLENDLRSAVKKNEFLLYYQPQINIKTGKVIGMEALIRWKHPKMGIVSPAIFIPLAEETGLIVQMGDWVLETACMDVQKIIANGYPEMRVAVNLSGIQFKQKEIAEKISNILIKTGLDSKHLELELTESIAMENVENTIHKLQEINLMKIFLSIDDFGTGYSSLNYLKKYPINKLKIDQSFVRDIVKDNDDAVIVETIVAMAHSLRLNVIAEGVETGDQLDFLKRFGCDEVQGYLFGKPVPIDLFIEMISDKAYQEVLSMFAGQNFIENYTEI